MVDYSGLMTRYKDVFTGIGKLKDFQLNLHIDQQVQRVAQPLRRPAFSLREKIEKKLMNFSRKILLRKLKVQRLGKTLLWWCPSPMVM